MLFTSSSVSIVYLFLLFFFFFQAEDGIRDIGVTGVQTCALPILSAEPELDQILDDRMGGGLQNRLRGFRGTDARAPWWPLIGEELHGGHFLLGEGGGSRVDDQHPGKVPVQKLRQDVIP